MGFCYSKKLFIHNDLGIVHSRNHISVKNAKQLDLKPLILFSYSSDGFSDNLSLLYENASDINISDLLSNLWRSSTAYIKPDELHINVNQASDIPLLSDVIDNAGVKLIFTDGKNRLHTGKVASAQKIFLSGFGFYPLSLNTKALLKGHNRYQLSWAGISGSHQFKSNEIEHNYMASASEKDRPLIDPLMPLALIGNNWKRTGQSVNTKFTHFEVAETGSNSTFISPGIEDEFNLIDANIITEYDGYMQNLFREECLDYFNAIPLSEDNMSIMLELPNDTITNFLDGSLNLRANVFFRVLNKLRLRLNIEDKYDEEDPFFELMESANTASFYPSKEILFMPSSIDEIISISALYEETGEVQCLVQVKINHQTDYQYVLLMHQTKKGSGFRYSDVKALFLVKHSLDTKELQAANIPFQLIMANTDLTNLVIDNTAMCQKAKTFDLSSSLFKRNESKALKEYEAVLFK